MYSASEDSFFFAEFLDDYFSKLKNKNIFYLDMGSGSGILSNIALRHISKKNIIACDVDKDSVNFIKKLGIEAIKSNLFSSEKFKNKKFDLITFNAPYLPDDKFDKKQDTSGGKKGDEISIKFLKQAKNYLNENGKIFLLISSFTPMGRLEKFKPKIVARKKIFFEELFIFEI